MASDSQSSSSSSAAAPTTGDNSTSGSAQSFSIYDRDLPKDPVSQISKYGLTFSQRTTPLLSRYSRLDRKEMSTRVLHDPSSLVGPVSWVLVRDRNSFKVMDRSTNALIGKWKLLSDINSSNGGSARRKSNPNPTQSSALSELLGDRLNSPPVTGLGMANYFDMDSAKTPFFSGDFVSLNVKADQDKVTWCFVVKNVIVAALKGNELSIITPPAAGTNDNTATTSALMSSVFLDEFTKALRQKVLTKVAINPSPVSMPPSNQASTASTASLASVVEESMDSKKRNSMSGGMFRRSPSFPKTPNRRHTLMDLTMSTPRPSSDMNSTSSAQQLDVHSPPVLGSSYENAASSFLRLKFSDAVMMAAMSLMLNLDDRIRELQLSPKQQRTQAHESENAIPRMSLNHGRSSTKNAATPSAKATPESDDLVSHTTTHSTSKSARSKRKSFFKLPSFLRIKALRS